MIKKFLIIFIFFLTGIATVACTNSNNLKVNDTEILGEYNGISITKEKLKDMQDIVKNAPSTENDSFGFTKEQLEQEIYDPNKDGIVEEAQRTSIPEGALSIDDMKIILEEYKEFLK